MIIPELRELLRSAGHFQTLSKQINTDIFGREIGFPVRFVFVGYEKDLRNFGFSGLSIFRIKFSAVS